MTVTMQIASPRHDAPGRGDDVLVIEQLTVDLDGPHGRTPIIEDVSLRIGRAQTLGLVGESGSGKSITSAAILGLLPSQRLRIAKGSIRVEGRELVGASGRELEDVRGSSVGIIFQNPMSSLNPAFTVGDQIAETVRRHRGWTRARCRARAVEVLDMVGVPSPRRRVKQYPHEFSGGMAQRVVLAIALACEPRLLIADEPTTALDVTVQAQILTLLKAMRAELGLSMLFVTHDLSVIADVADHVAVIYAGQVVEQAHVDEIFARPRHPYTRALLRATPYSTPRGAELPLIPGRPPLPSEFGTGCRFHPRCEFGRMSCLEPVPLIDHGEGSSRCRRHDELFGDRSQRP